ncbi:MAG TPA: serine hydrolase domain-containing protein [Blastocatellia bacterium]|nr:serine hydrolase domain-containing protein [Blastocatellia bacterium]HMX25258.1 serine hydrolase domain-containing protein [Blastocatellia bacterium]HMY70344.1 serine hydrolase domain-containing protein [Blastocatellia bacterium]HMZ17520.1 serine hydrolase domain-containing protein [Blastocatellia bacterium]HNG31357.1 serine hydrolase domain-containing protein [Blastocatellia bacterium]
MNTRVKFGNAVFLMVTLMSSALFAQAPDQAKVIAGAERAFEKLAKLSPASAPGCAVGVSLAGRPVFEKAFGMAEIEHAISNTPQTIFESGSVAKQFTAAAVILLSLEGKLGLDDPVRKYIPELPDYGAPLTIRHLLNHTGGVRDWGSVLALTGFGRGDRMISQSLAMDVVTHQKGLDFTPGAEYSYSNSGYTLASTIVERVSKQSLPVFTAERFFKPLGMTHTSWRDDYQRLIPGRAQAYTGSLAGPWRLLMPFMNVYGNGGMLTTVGDWLKWNAMLDSRSMGAPLVEALETTGVLNDGRKISYALGVVVTNEHGHRSVSHGGSTAGYQTYLSRYPDLKLSIAVMCNSASRNPANIEREIFTEIVGPFPAQTPPATIVLKPEELQKYVALWRNEKTHLPERTVVENGVLRLAGQATLRPLREGAFLAGSSSRITFKMGKDGTPISFETDSGEAVARFVVESQWTPTPDELKSFAGVWHSDEADASFTIAVENDKAFFVQRPDTRQLLRPQFKDHFSVGFGPGQVLWVTRDANGQITKLHIGASRMRDMPFERAGK